MATREIRDFDDLVDNILFHLIYTLGRGARMNITLDALEAIRCHVRENFYYTIDVAQDMNDPSSIPRGEARWQKAKRALLPLTETIGAHAASKAIERGSSVIEWNDLKAAYNLVSLNNQDEQPGSWCPTIED